MYTSLKTLSFTIKYDVPHSLLEFSFSSIGTLPCDINFSATNGYKIKSHNRQTICTHSCLLLCPSQPVMEKLPIAIHQRGRELVERITQALKEFDEFLVQGTGQDYTIHVNPTTTVEKVTSLTASEVEPLSFDDITETDATPIASKDLAAMGSHSLLTSSEAEEISLSSTQNRIRFHLALMEKGLAFQVIRMDEAFRATGQQKTFSTGVFSIVSDTRPLLGSRIIHLQGADRTADNTIVTKHFPTNVLRDQYATELLTALIQWQQHWEGFRLVLPTKLPATSVYAI